MYLHEILWICTAPVVIYVSYILVIKGIKFYEKKEKLNNEE